MWVLEHLPFNWLQVSQDNPLSFHMNLLLSPQQSYAAEERLAERLQATHNRWEYFQVSDQSWNSGAVPG